VTRAVHVFVSGRVQGVGFRWSVRAEARRRELAGWVRNRRDGRVELVLQGEEPRVEGALAWLRGPSAPGRVDAVTSSPTEPAATTGFEIRPTT